MELQRITESFYDTAWDLMCSSFPIHEMRSCQAQWALVSHPAFCGDIILHDGQFAGVLFYWLFDGMCFVEHFATLPSVRGGGIGAAAMSALLEQHPLTVLEIDPVTDDISRRRRGFYERVGFVENPYEYYHPGYAPSFTRHPLRVMSAPRILTRVELETFQEFNYRTVCDSL